MRSQYLRSLYLGFFFVLSLASQPANGGNVNVTVDDTDFLITYSPADAWYTQDTVCSSCLKVDIGKVDVFENTYHGASLSEDPDDKEGQDEDDNSSGQTGNDGNPDYSSQNATRRGRNHSILDSDAPDSDDTPVTAQFTFNGQLRLDLYLNPVGFSSVSPTNMNLTFTLDNQTVGTYIHETSNTTAEPTPHFNVFSKENLTPSPHVLQASLGVNSVFLIDYMIYTKNDVVSQGSGSQTTGVDPPKNHVATFEGAIGGSVGVLATLALCIFLSIYGRRRLAARRDRRERAEIAAASPLMIGPAPFMPRYFPGTVPPPYAPSAASSAQVDTHHSSGTENMLNYADVPPSTPPPQDPQSLGLPPPSFAEAIADTSASVRIPIPGAGSAEATGITLPSANSDAPT
ncbi:uncharacterized protein ARMOST_14066 [Armillaria ostoyae]|uniref:Uncharacterized protein n=1 Tax=Armillaria ostoyae TaxID=47428 RepID=A0A284RPP7_ARMOS|nr:uncharacterized protein ARMOST_14066 [Armillaria ostoyae]